MRYSQFGWVGGSRRESRRRARVGLQCTSPCALPSQQGGRVSVARPSARPVGCHAAHKVKVGWTEPQASSSTCLLALAACMPMEPWSVLDGLRDAVNALMSRHPL
eukprot:5807813-Pleurochrysis_carterae.AAC.1